MNSFNGKTVVVLGMHRSGTSAITNALTVGGLYCGREKDILPADRSNEKGYFERKQVIELNEQLLIDRFLSSSNQFPEIRQLAESVNLKKSGWILGGFVSSAGADFTESRETEISKYATSIYSEFHQGSDVILKDPRFSLTLPTWKPYLNNVVSIVMVRNPAEVAKSLLVREALPEFLSRQLWDIYTNAALVVTADMPRIIIDYADLMTDPVNTLERIFEFLALNDLSLDVKKIKQATEHIDPVLYHNRIKGQDSGSKLFAHQIEHYHAVARGHPGEFPIDVEAGSAADLHRQYANCSLMLSLLDKKFLRQDLNSRIRELKCEIEREANLCNQRIDRINRHIISGSVLKFLRLVKRDNSFGR